MLPQYARKLLRRLRYGSIPLAYPHMLEEKATDAELVEIGYIGFVQKLKCDAEKAWVAKGSRHILM